MQAYYDEKLKRWIFPGDDPATVAKPLPPPPTMPITKKGSEMQNTKTPLKENDPLASLMAPPSRTPQHGVGQGGIADLMAPPSRVARSHFSEPRVKASSRHPNAMNTSSSTQKPVAEPLSKPPAPHFVIFQPPKATQSSEEQTEK